MGRDNHILDRHAESGVRVERLEPRKLFDGTASISDHGMDHYSTAATEYTFDLGHAAAPLSAQMAGPTSALLASPSNKLGAPRSNAFLLKHGGETSALRGTVVVTPTGNDSILTGRFAGSVWGDAREAQKGAEANGSLPPTKKNKGLVLVVEDDPGSRNALSVILKKRGWDVATAASVAEGMQQLKSQPDGMIVDLMLPDGDGADLIRQVREDGMTTRVTVMTGSSDMERLGKVRDLEPDAMLQKPISVAQLLRSLPDVQVQQLAA